MQNTTAVNTVVPVVQKTATEQVVDPNVPILPANNAAQGEYHPNYTNMTFADYINDPFTQHRLRQLLSFANPAKNRFNIGLFADNTKWAAPPPGSRGLGAERMLSIGTTPAVCWIIGTVRFIQTKNRRFVIGVEPLSVHDNACAKAIQYGKARPSQSAPGKSQLVYASKFLNNGVFDETYDATDDLYAWSEMQDNKISYRHIRQTNVVLLECLIRRYTPANAASNNAWSTFSIAFELARIAHLGISSGIPDYLPD
ncbi:hypothetical protein LXA43DRAFT_1066595 [Ganoderma leucocontextum]|nr:hypothetical protein LXA43DRAFT_1066595 [Ganoderma leucocontextum]